MKKLLIVLLILCVAVPESQAWFLKKKAAVAGGGGESPVWKMVVADTGNNRLMKRTGSMATYDNQVVTAGAGDNLSLPQNVSISGQFLYAVDSNNNRVVKYNLADLTYIIKAGSSGSADNQVNYPLSLLAYGDNVYISDTYNNRVLVWKASDLTYVAKISTTGSPTDNAFNHPDGICTDNTNLYVSDTYEHRVVKHRISDLAFLAQFYDAGVTPSGAATNGTHVWVTDINNHLIVKLLASDMSYVDYCGTGNGSGDTQLNHPDGITWDNGYLYVADRDNSRIVKWADTCSIGTGFTAKYGTNGTGNDNLSTTVYGVAVGYQQ